MNNPDEIEYGRLLYDEKPESYRLMWMWARPRGFVDVLPLALELVIAGIICFIGSLLGLPITAWFLLPAVAGLLMLFFGGKAFFESIWSFKVYEKGLRPQWKHFPLFRFADVDHLRIIRGRLELVTKKGRTYNLFFVDEAEKGPEPERHTRLMQTIIEQMKKTHPGENPLKLVRDISSVEWSKEAEEEYLRHWNRPVREVDSTNQQDLKADISEAVLKEGSERVELADVRGFLK